MEYKPKHHGIWVPSDASSDLEVACSAVAQVLRGADNWGWRLTVAHGVRNVSYQPSVEAFASNGNILTPMNASRRQIKTGGPVLAFVPDDKTLALAVGHCSGQVLGVVEYAVPSMRGWAAAVGAVNVLTGEKEPGVDDSTRQSFDELIGIGYKGYSKRDRYVMAVARPAIEKLTADGYDADFIVSYGIACGLHDSQAKELRALLA